MSPCRLPCPSPVPVPDSYSPSNWNSRRHYTRSTIPMQPQLPKNEPFPSTYPFQRKLEDFPHIGPWDWSCGSILFRTHRLHCRFDHSSIGKLQTFVPVSLKILVSARSTRIFAIPIPPSICLRSLPLKSPRPFRPEGAQRGFIINGGAGTSLRLCFASRCHRSASAASGTRTKTDASELLEDWKANASKECCSTGRPVG